MVPEKLVRGQPSIGDVTTTIPHIHSMAATDTALCFQASMLQFVEVA